ncbi:hypothetical protein DAEQUDRAFT_758717 [Daedalea quercina L-15889]|uniref:Uncharacterized protein n=1 Tax=Daedalea quercina L-15889 TaxID=1314783 RepID=A0A165N4D4_9APHY|nr:hypothetical protein DAEQUDRAFT_758717 [Daedalea quercina L-15889]
MTAMSMSRLTITISPLLTGIVAVRYNSDTGTTNTGTRSAKRERDEMEGPNTSNEHLSPPTPEIVIRLFQEGDAANNAGNNIHPPPSPVPTEVDEQSPVITQAEATEAAKAAGVKVRDFAYEPDSPKKRAPEVWHNPLHTLAVHDRYLRAGPSWRGMLRLPGKMLWRLMDSGLVTPEEADHNWPQEDQDACAAYASRPGGPYPYIMPPVRKLTAEYRRCICFATYGLVTEDDIPEEEIYMPSNTDDMDDGTSEVSGGCYRTGNLSPDGVITINGEKTDTARDTSSAVAADSLPQAKKQRTIDTNAQTTSSLPTDSLPVSSSPHRLPSAASPDEASEDPLPSAPIAHAQVQPPGNVPAVDSSPSRRRPLRRSALARTESII